MGQCLKKGTAFAVFFSTKHISRMKKQLILFSILPVLLYSCGTQKKTTTSLPVVQESVEPTLAESQSSSSTLSPIYMQHIEESRNQFAINLYRAVSRTEQGRTDNVVVSPYSAGVALSMLLEGADASTREELLKALSSSPYSGLSLQGDDNVIISSANSVWFRAGFALKPEYKMTLDKSYSAQLYQKDFSQSTVGEINKWCSDNTNGKIPSIIDRIDPSSMMYILNALYFKAPWAFPFRKNATSKQVFHSQRGDEQIDFMHIERDFRYAEVEGVQVVRLDYKGGRYYMLVCLPSEDENVDLIADYISCDLFNKAQSYLRTNKVILSLPKFKLEGEMILNSVLQSMGINEAFSNRADFSRMTNASVCVDQVKQKTFIEVSEEGTEAAAVTSIGVKLTSVRPQEQSPVIMTVDRPFVFAIMDGEQNDILFMGNIRNLK